MNRFAGISNPETEISVSDKVFIGKNVVLGPRCKSVRIGFGSFIGNDIYIDVNDLQIGDYTTIHHGSVLHGERTSIGHNCWIGHYTIIDSLGGNTRLGNNVGVGAHSQLWSHMRFGDVLQGCRWHSSGPLILDDDVWLVGHSIVGPIHARPRSMLMTGGVAVKDMEENHIYAGAPARDCTERFGVQFVDVTFEQKVEGFSRLRDTFCAQNGVDCSRFPIVDKLSSRLDATEFNVRERTYKPIRDELEYSFIKFMLYDKAKWIPVTI